MRRKPINIVEKTWGSEEWIVNNELYCGKILRIKEGHYTSWHYHELKTETFQVLKGALKVYYSEYDDFPLYRKRYKLGTYPRYTILQKGECFDVPIRMRHRLEAYKGKVKFLEISTHHEDSDSIRLIKGD